MEEKTSGYERTGMGAELKLLLREPPLLLSILAAVSYTHLTLPTTPYV